MVNLILQYHKQLFVLKQYIPLKSASVNVLTIFQSSLDTTGAGAVIFQIHCDEAGMPALHGGNLLVGTIVFASIFGPHF